MMGNEGTHILLATFSSSPFHSFFPESFIRFLNFYLARVFLVIVYFCLKSFLIIKCATKILSDFWHYPPPIRPVFALFIIKSSNNRFSSFPPILSCAVLNDHCAVVGNGFMVSLCALLVLRYAAYLSGFLLSANLHSQKAVLMRFISLFTNNLFPEKCGSNFCS